MVAEEPQQQNQEPLGCDSEGVSCLAYDEATIAQRDQIQQETAGQNPLVSERHMLRMTISTNRSGFPKHIHYLIEQVEKQTSVADPLASFNDQRTSDYLVVYLRLLTLGYLQRESKFFEHFIEALSVSIQVEYMDCGQSGTTNPHIFPKGSEPKVYLLYQPGHYDILYK
ncbi:Ubiquitin thioesterase OTUB1 [Tupaia chinensis]|uniref:Ubiquitin thioesterase OTUB1 n=1 Tax=Tupaia chinensis TaxID=246437 RepID=L9LAP0_TUPCH|nr:Ubiquitin thioesterase OTUB1 [Tupaia chinensis]